jgi:hypothetical protein
MKTILLTILAALAVANPAPAKSPGDYLFLRYNGAGQDQVVSTPTANSFLTSDGSGNLVWVTKSSYQTAISSGTTAQFYRGDKTFVTLNVAALADTKTGSGNIVLATSPTISSATLNSPTLVTPSIGSATGTSLKLGGSINDSNLPMQIFGSVAQYSVSRTNGAYGLLFGSYDSTTYTMRSVTATDKISFIVNNTVQALNIYPSGGVAVGTLTDAGNGNMIVNGSLTTNSNSVRIGTSRTPTSASDGGLPGQICWDANYLYVCTATNTWKRVAISTW